MENASPSASSPINPHFFQPLLPGFQSHLNIPTAFFSKYIEGTRNDGKSLVELRSDASDITWKVKMVGRRLTQGWEKFATSHDLRVGDIVIFRHDGDFQFHVTSFGPSCCEMEYNDDIIHIQLPSDVEKSQQPTRGARSSSGDSYFVARVTAWNLHKDMLILPRDFSRTNGLMNRECEIILLNEDGKPWTLFLAPHKSGRWVYIRTGWRSFCLDNRKRVDESLTFELVKSTTGPVLQLCSSVYKHNRKCFRASTSSSSSLSSTSQKRFLTLTLKPWNIKSYNLYLPGIFVRSNGIQDARMITLVDRYGIKRTTSLKAQSKNGMMRIGKGWREFCEANGVKTGESFKLELIKKEEDRATHLLKFCSKVLN